MLTDAAIKAARATKKPVKLFDERGLYLLVTPAGGRWWRLKYRFAGRERGLSLGTYPDVPLRLARERRDEARKLVAAGTDPSVERQRERLAQHLTFGLIAEEWLALQAKKFATPTLDKARWMFEEFLLPRLGGRPIRDITAPEVLGVLRTIEARGIHETAHRVKMRTGQVFRYAIATGRAERDVTADLRGALAPVVSTNHAAIVDPTRLGELLRAIDGYQGQPSPMFALRLAPLVFVRPGELRAAEWQEFTLDGKEPEWRIPAERMKMGERHIVPLARQAVEILRHLEAITRYSQYVFPSLRSAQRPMSNNAITAALRRMGYSGEEMTGHGFRSVASTLLNEQGWAPDLIELQLAHSERNKVRAAYNRAERLEERRKMMQAWADFLDRLRTAGSDAAPKRGAA